MKKKFRLSICFQVINRVLKHFTVGDNVPEYQVNTEKHQKFIDFIKNNDSYLEQIMAGFFHRSLANHSTLDEELASFLNLKYFDEIAVEIAKEMGPEYETFINSIYNRSEEEDDTATFKRKIDKGIIEECFANFEIISASLKQVSIEEY
ncbi:MAG: hypothetical protein MUF15_28100 [Acidobacteria bacterium]|nr:hypothetical protein [Acidobacteriota bacterium]